VTASLQDDLADLTGEQLYHLIIELGRGQAEAMDAMMNPAPGRIPNGSLAGLWTDLADAELIALAQIARITVPIREATAIIWRAVYSRHHPVRVPGTGH
jgi:hypothetical protein